MQRDVKHNTEAQRGLLPTTSWAVDRKQDPMIHFEELCFDTMTMII